MKISLFLSLLLAGSALAQQPGQITEKDLANCSEEAKKAYLEFSHKLSAWHASVAVKAVRKFPDKLLENSLANATGRGKQFQDVTAYGLSQYCNDLKAVDDAASK